MYLNILVSMDYDRLGNNSFCEPYRFRQANTEPSLLLYYYRFDDPNMPHSTEDSAPTVEAFVNYHQPPPEGEVFPVQYVTTVGFQRQKYDRQLVTVTDIRQCDKIFSLDKQGFEVVQSTIQEKKWDGDYRFGLPPQLNKDVQEMVMRQ